MEVLVVVNFSLFLTPLRVFLCPLATHPFAQSDARHSRRRTSFRKTKQKTKKKGAVDYKSIFEMVIRNLGGLISAYDLNGQPIFLAKALELADILLYSHKWYYGPNNNYTLLHGHQMDIRYPYLIGKPKINDPFTCHFLNYTASWIGYFKGARTRFSLSLVSLYPSWNGSERQKSIANCWAQPFGSRAINSNPLTPACVFF